MKALVTGGGGFLGKAVTKALIDRGDDVCTFARGDYPELRTLGATHLRGDVGDLEALTAAVTSCDVVFHVASLVATFGKREDFVRINVEGTRNVTRACIAQGVRNLVFTSTPSVVHSDKDACGIDESAPYPESFLCHYFWSKALAEKEVLAQNGAALAPAYVDKGPLRVVALRPHAIFGPGDTSLFPWLIARAKSGRLRIIGSGATQIDWTYVDNAVDAHLLAADALCKDPCPCAGKAYFIANDEPVNPWVFFNGILQALDVAPISRKVPLGLAKAMGRMAEGVWSTFALKGEPPGTRAMASVLGTSHFFDLSAAKRDLGYRPRVSLAEGVERTVPWLKREIAAGRI